MEEFQDAALSLVKPMLPFDSALWAAATIAQRVAKGMTHKEIAQLLKQSPATVRKQIQAIYGKLGIGSVGKLTEALQLLA